MLNWVLAFFLLSTPETESERTFGATTHAPLAAETLAPVVVTEILLKELENDCTSFSASHAQI